MLGDNPIDQARWSYIEGWVPDSGPYWREPGRPDVSNFPAIALRQTVKPELTRQQLQP